MKKYIAALHKRINGQTVKSSIQILPVKNKFNIKRHLKDCIEVEIEDLPKYAGMTVYAVGSENIYFGRFFCKVNGYEEGGRI